MKGKDLTTLSDEELLAEHKKMKSANVAGAFLIGLLIGVAIFGSIKNGPGFFTFLPLVFIFLLTNNRKNIKPVEEELRSRNLK